MVSNTKAVLKVLCGCSLLSLLSKTLLLFLVLLKVCQTYENILIY